MTLRSLAVGSTVLSPTFDPATTTYQAVYTFPSDAQLSDEFTLQIVGVPKDPRCTVTYYWRTSPRPNYELIEIEDGIFTITPNNNMVQNAKIIYAFVDAPNGGQKRYLVNVYGVRET